MSLISSLRQLRQPEAFRINAPRWPEFSEVLEKLIYYLQTSSPEIETGYDEKLLTLITDVGTTTWRLQRRLGSKEDVTEEDRRTSRP